MAELNTDSQYQFAGAAAEFAIEQVMGPGDLFIAVRQSWLRRKSKAWKEVTGTIRGHYFLRWASNAGWFEAVYTYKVDGQIFTGNLRQWVRSKTPVTGSDSATIGFFNRFPTGSPVRVRVDPLNPARSVSAPV